MTRTRALICRSASCLALLMILCGCESANKDREMRMANGYTYYCDGAGGGGLMNWSGGLRQGLIKGGYEGAGEIFPWNTGAGVVADQDSSVEYKRGKAKEMAKKTADYSKEHPDAPVTFIGLSAGTSVVVYALEELPSGTTVNNAVMCGASISSTYNLTRALRNLDGNMYVFTSQNDGVLGFLVPMAGTADREAGSVPAAGLRGFVRPRGSTPETSKLYAKVVTIPWRPEFAKFGYTGGHTDVLSERFVQAYMAPRLVKKVGKVPTELASTKGKVNNPDYARWANYGVGSYLVIEGYQEHKGVRAPIRIKATLKSKSRDRLLVERRHFLTDADAEFPAEIHSLIAERLIEPPHHPSTDPKAKLKDLPAKRFTVKGRALECKGRSIDADGNYPDWGSDLMATAYRCADLPGGLVSLDLESHFQGEDFRFSGKVVDYKIVK